MRARLRRAVLVAAAVACAAGTTAAATSRGAATAAPGPVDARVKATLALPDARSGGVAPVAPARPDAAAGAALAGPTRSWLALDMSRSNLYTKQFVLAATGKRVEIWVARNLAFPAGDCRNRVDGGARIRVTKKQATYLAQQFDRVIYERQRPHFGVPRARNGTQALDRRFARKGRGDRVVVLVDNVRDANFYDRDNARNLPYVAGFHAESLSRAVDRNVVTVDAYDWPHRLGANPPHKPVPGDNCASAPARPFLYEATLAHEYQHLLQQMQDQRRREAEWVDEGLADYAQLLAGYMRPARRVDQRGFDAHTQCILGWLSVQTPFNPQPRPSGPENSLTIWEDAGSDRILCDYGAAYTFVQLLVDRYGARAASLLFRDPAVSLAGVSNVLARIAPGVDTATFLHDWAATLALDGVLERGTPLRYGNPARFTSRTLSATINWDNAGAYAAPGAPPNGSDYVRLRDAGGRYLDGAELASLEFRTTRARGSARFNVQLIAYATDRAVPATHITLSLENGAATLDAAQLAALVDPRADVVAAIVTYTDTDESQQQPGRYALVVNGVTQPGG